ncbi:MAG: glycosyltransferase family 2 protein [Patescibacteria group bacterium]
MTVAGGDDHPRWLEFLPATLTWGSFGLLLIGSFLAPAIVASFMLVYALFWFSRSLLMSARLIVGYVRYRRDIQRNWLQELNDHYPRDTVDQLYHLVIVAVSKEDPLIVASTLEAIKASEYPMRQLLVVVACEARFAENAAAVEQMIQKDYRKTFGHIFVSKHPPDIQGEVIGKGGNISWAGRLSERYLDSQKISYDRVICTTLDADNRVHKKYFAALSCALLRHPTPLYASFQPIPMFFNNIWDVPLPIRSVALGSSFWQIMESTRPYRLRNFSAHAQSFAALVKTDYWSVKTAVEDGHQFWRTYFRFQGKHDVVPLNVPVYQDAVLSPKGYWETFREQYLQKRRWACGCSDIPYVLWRVYRNHSLPRFDKWLQVARLIEGHYSWATTSVILAFFGWIPRYLNPGFQNEVIAYTFPPLYGSILTLALIGLVVTFSVSVLLLPPVPKNRLKRSRFSVVLEWVTAPILLPISNIAFSSLPAIDAQTRLFFGKYLEFRVTEKHTHRQDISNHPAAR